MWVGLQVVTLGVVAAAVGLGPVGWVIGVAYGLGTWILLGPALHRGLALASTATVGRASTPTSTSASSSPVGPANRVTLARGLLVGVVTALVADRADGDMPVALLIVVSSIALTLDWVDGRVARRTGTTTEVGARFDMEVDAFLILVLSVYVAAHLGPWVLAIGLMRYVFVAASWQYRWMRKPLPPSFARKVVAAAQGIVLVVAASALIPFAGILVAAALASLVWSFGRDVHWLWINASTRWQNPHMSQQTSLGSKIVNVVVWILQIALALEFFRNGSALFTDQFVAKFDDIGFGQWFRYFTGVLEIAAAVGLLIPRICGFAALALAGIMAGAALTEIFLVTNGGFDDARLPIIYMLWALAIAAYRSREMLGLVARVRR